MKNKILTGLFFTSLLITLPSQAGEWSGSADIKKIYPHSTNNTDGTIYIAFDIMKNPSSCTRTEFIALKKSNNLSSEIYSLVLTAFSTGAKVNYYSDGCDTLGYPELLHITLSK